MPIETNKHRRLAAAYREVAKEHRRAAQEWREAGEELRAEVHTDLAQERAQQAVSYEETALREKA